LSSPIEHPSSGRPWPAATLSRPQPPLALADWCRRKKTLDVPRTLALGMCNVRSQGVGDSISPDSALLAYLRKTAPNFVETGSANLRFHRALPMSDSGAEGTVSGLVRLCREIYDEVDVSCRTAWGRSNPLCPRPLGSSLVLSFAYVF